MTGILNSIKNFFRGSESKDTAKSRLHFVLVQDRTGLGNEEITAFKRELVEVIEKYFVINEKGFDITYKRDSDLTTLLINSPIIVKRRTTISEDKNRKSAANLRK